MPTLKTPAELLDERVYSYFQAGRVTVAETFTPDEGWRAWVRYRKGITHSWARKLRRAGVTAVALTDGHRTADFSLSELLSASS